VGGKRDQRRHVIGQTTASRTIVTPAALARPRAPIAMRRARIGEQRATARIHVSLVELSLEGHHATNQPAQATTDGRWCPLNGSGG